MRSLNNVFWCEFYFINITLLLCYMCRPTRGSIWIRCERLSGWVLSYHSGTEIPVIATDELSCIRHCAADGRCEASYFDIISHECFRRNWPRMALYRGSDQHRMCLFHRRKTTLIIDRLDTGYSYTFDEAEVECARTTGRLMTRDELQAMQQTGYHRCNCGWLADGSTMFPMTEIVPSCSAQAGQIGLIECTTSQPNGIWCVID